MPILATKLYIPPPPSKIVPRTHLIERLNEGLHRKLTLISAPAGFGKTNLVSEWVAGCERPTAWLSLDEGDNEPTRFLVYLIAAMQSIAVNLGAGVLGALQSPQPPATESILTALLNEMTALPDHFMLVLDDYHLIDSKPIDQALTFLIEHLPPQMHLVMTTREDPHLPLARLRVRGQLTELRVADLRFTRAEAADFLNRVMGLNILEADIAALETRTEGWIAGLQMAALALQGLALHDPVSVQGHPNPRRFIESFTGSHRFVLDYLVEEVLLQQPENIQAFLLRTSILDRLCAPLCEAVVSDPAMPGQQTLDYLEHANLFLISLDHERRWFRYHHLFAELLRQRLQQSDASAMADEGRGVAELHNRASQWHEQHGLSADAIHHALAAENFERAANLVEREWPALHRSHFRSATTLGWMRALPDELVRARPVLSVGYAWELLNVGELEAAEAWLSDAERWLELPADLGEQPEPSPANRVVIDEAEFRSLPSSIATARAYHALALGNVPGTVTHARRALDLYPEKDYVGRGPAAALLGLAYWASGELEAAHQTLAAGMASFQMAGNILFAISGTYGLADIRIAQGRLHEAMHIYEQALQLAIAQGEPVLQGTADLYLGLSELYHEQGDLEFAAKHLLTSETLGEPAALPNWPYRLRLAQARMKQAQGDLDGALQRLDEAERLYIRGPVPDLRSIATLKTRVWVAQGKLTKALGWAHERGLSVDDELSYLREFEHMTLARVLIAQHRRNRVEGSMLTVMQLLQRLLQAAEVGGRTGNVIEILVLQALAHEAQADISAALAALERALTLAEPEGYVRIFVDEGPPMAALLQEAAKQRIAPNYVSDLQVALGKAEGPAPIPAPLIAPPTWVREPLSEREIEVLRLLRTELSGPELSRELLVSLNTLRTHTKNIFSKLGVNNRRAAVRRADELGLF